MPPLTLLDVNPEGGATLRPEQKARLRGGWRPVRLSVTERPLPLRANQSRAGEQPGSLWPLGPRLESPPALGMGEFPANQ